MSYKTDTEDFTVDGVMYWKVTNLDTGSVCYCKQDEDEILSQSITPEEYEECKVQNEECKMEGEKCL